MIRKRAKVICRTLSYHLDEDLIRKVTNLAKTLGMSRSQVVESLIRSGLEHETRCTRFVEPSNDNIGGHIVSLK